MTTTNISSAGKTTVAFEEFEKVEPEDLIALSSDYIKSLPGLMKYLTERANYKELSLNRIEPNGSIKQKNIYGYISNLDLKTGSFFFTSKENMSEIENEDGYQTLIRIDNVLGIVPTIPGKEIDIYKNSMELSSLQYFSCLGKMKNLLKAFVGREHLATLYFRFNKKDEFRRNGIFSIEGEILEVNNSNVKLKQFRSFASDEHDKVVELGKIEKIELFSTPERYLSKVTVWPQKTTPNYQDDDYD